MINFRRVSLACTAFAFAVQAQAAGKSVDPVLQVQTAIEEATRSLASGAKVASFQYRTNKIYEVSIKAGMFTTFTFPKGEKIKQFALSMPDAAEIDVNEETNSAMLRLISGITLSATIVTSKNTYYLTIVPSSGQWHQGVSWTYGEPGTDTAGGFGYRAPAGSSAQADVGADTPEDSLAGQPNFNYTVKGDAAVSPVAVWDNGRFTWLQFSDAVQSIPAVFILGPSGPEVVNYIVQPGGRQVKVNRLMSKILLRLGSQKAIVTAK